MTALAPMSHAWRLGDLLDGLVEGGWLPPGVVTERQVVDLATDSRDVIPGALFLACRGRTVHGLAFADEARRRGACAILAEVSDEWPREHIFDLGGRLGLPVIPVPRLPDLLGLIADRFFDSPSSYLEVVGVTGRHGKSTLCHLLAQVLDRDGACGILSTLGCGLIASPKAGDAVRRDPLSMHRALSDLGVRGAKAVALELSSPDLAGARLAGMRLAYLVFTDAPGLTARERQVELEAIARRCEQGHLEWLIVNLDDPAQAGLAQRLASSTRVAGYRSKPGGADSEGCELVVSATAVEARLRGLEIQVECARGDDVECSRLEVALVGEASASNVLAILTVLCARGFPLEQAVRELVGLRGAPGRMECFGGVEAPLVVVDAAKTSVSLAHALESLRQHPCRRIITVVGCDGRADPAQRSLIGAVAERLSDRVIFTDDNPRAVCGDQIVADLLGGVAHPQAVMVERQRGLAIRLAIALAGVGDAVLIAGKGHETVQDMGELKVHFSDRAQVVEALREWREGHH